MRDPVYEARTGAPARPETIAVRRWIHTTYLSDREAFPGRVRYYEAISAGVITKHAAATAVGKGGITAGDRTWNDAILWVREHTHPDTGLPLVPDSWVTDETRNVDDWTGHESLAEAVASHVRYVRLDCWDGEPPAIIVESRATAAVLEPLIVEYRLWVAPLGGQASRSFLANDVAPKMYDGQVVLAVVDFDKAGGDIANSAQSRLEQFTGYTFDWRHLALTAEQVEDFDIPLIPRLDRRPGHGGLRMVAETEALGVARLRAIVRAELDRLLPEPLVAVRERERDERVDLFRALGLSDEGYQE